MSPWIWAALGLFVGFIAFAIFVRVLADWYPDEEEGA